MGLHFVISKCELLSDTSQPLLTVMQFTPIHFSQRTDLFPLRMSRLLHFNQIRLNARQAIRRKQGSSLPNSGERAVIFQTDFGKKNLQVSWGPVLPGHSTISDALSRTLERKNTTIHR